MKHPMQFAYHVGHDLVANRVDIFTEVTSAVTAYKAQQSAGKRHVETEEHVERSRTAHRTSVKVVCREGLAFTGGRCSARTSVRP